MADSSNGVSSTGASGKYRTYTRGDTHADAPKGPSGQYRTYTKGDQSPNAPTPAPEQKQENTTPQNQQQGREELKSGVYVGNKGEQVIVKEGSKAQNAQELINAIKSGNYQPTRLGNAKGGPLENKAVGIKQGENVYLPEGQTLTQRDEQGNITAQGNAFTTKQEENIKAQSPFTPSNGQLSSGAIDSGSNDRTRNYSSVLGSGQQGQEEGGRPSTGEVLQRLSPFYAIDKAIQERSPFAAGYQKYITNAATDFIDPNVRGVRKIGTDVAVRPIVSFLPESQQNALLDVVGGKTERGPTVGILADPDVQAATITGGLTAIGLSPLSATVGKIAGVGIGGTLLVDAGAKAVNNPTSSQVGESTAQATLGTVFVLSSLGSPLKVRTTEVPQTSGEVATIKTVGFEAGSRSVPLISQVKNAEGATSYSLGRANIASILENLPVATDVKIGSALETNQFIGTLKTIGTPRAQEAPQVVRSILRQTKNTNADVNGNLLLRTERLPEEGVKSLLGLAKEEEAVVFGSFSRQQQGVDLVPRDIDIRVSGASQERLIGIAEEGASRLRGIGLDARTIPEKAAIEVKSGNEYVKVAEFKGKELGPGEEAVPEFVLGLRKEGSPVEIAGQQFTRLSEETRGVAQGFTRVTKNEAGQIDIAPPPKRAKDVQSFVESAEVLRQSQFFERPGLKQNIQRIRELYPEYLTNTAPESVVLADFSPRSSLRGSPSVAAIEGSIGQSLFVTPETSSVSNTESPSSTKISPSVSKISLSSNSPLASPRSSVSGSTSSTPSPAPSSPARYNNNSSSPSAVIETSPSPIVSQSPSSSESPVTSPSPSPTKSPFSSSPPSPSQQTSPFAGKKKEQRSEELFDVETKEGGMFRTTFQGLRLDEAVRKADILINNTAKRSFIFTEKGTGQPISGATKEKAERLIDPTRYRKSKNDQNIFVEKNKSAINTAGEKLEIRPQRGVFGSKANKKKRTASIW